jgi:hypothetical protein
MFVGGVVKSAVADPLEENPIWAVFPNLAITAFR